MHRRVSPSLLRFLSHRPLQQSPSLLSQSLATVSSQSNPSSSQHFIPQIRHFYPAQRRFIGEASGDRIDVNQVVDEINLKFAEAREEIESAMESKETVYFNEEADCARSAVKEVLDLFEGLLSKVEEKERVSLRRSMGLKMEQLKAELQQLND